MPRLEIKHENTIMYKIVCNDLNITDLYVGKTTNFTVRKNDHKKNCCNDIYLAYNYKVYQFIREAGGWSNWSMLEIEKFPCTDSNEADSRERYWIETLKATLNSQVPSRKVNEYFQDNKESIMAKHKIWLLANKERQTEKLICECGSKYTFCNKTTHNKTKKHLAYLKNPEQLIISSSVICPCGGRYTSKQFLRHSRQEIHLSHFRNI
jgi:hypothetical protein